jgi:hypothetical protein
VLGVEHVKAASTSCVTSTHTHGCSTLNKKPRRAGRQERAQGGSPSSQLWQLTACLASCSAADAATAPIGSGQAKRGPTSLHFSFAMGVLRGRNSRTLKALLEARAPAPPSRKWPNGPTTGLLHLLLHSPPQLSSTQRSHLLHRYCRSGLLFGPPLSTSDTYRLPTQPGTA